MKIYLVGGAVRDDLLGLPVKDRDWVVVGATPEDMKKRGFRQVGADFPVFIHPDTGEEYALARTERKQGHGYHGFTVHSAPDVTLEDDLRRRDLTINAMALDRDNHLIDPFNGRKDLEAGILRHVSDAFAEDPLRVLRTARFAARFAPLGFTLANSTRDLMQQMVTDGEMEHLAAERVWQELQRALNERTPTVFFEVLESCGALAVLLPELTEPKPYRSGLAALACTSNQNETGEVRYAALLSPLTPEAVKLRSEALKAPNDYRELAVMVARYADELRAATGPESRLAVLEACDVWRRPERFERLIAVCRCLDPPLAPDVAQQLRQAETAARQVDPRVLMQDGYSGKALGQAIRNERLKKLHELHGTEP
ncbi:MAG: polynucleotide adenylyltransferase [Oleiphilaceae bacterium]|nr:polynucleotide adenylyltransferase [Oleiphilaceae bacterium]